MKGGQGKALQRSNGLLGADLGRGLDVELDGLHEPVVLLAGRGRGAAAVQGFLAGGEIVVFAVARPPAALRLVLRRKVRVQGGAIMGKIWCRRPKEHFDV